MKRFKNALFMATVASSALLSSAVSAQTIPAPASNDGDVALHGTGATSIQNVLVQELNCIAQHNQLGGNNSLTTVAEPTDLPVSVGGVFNCATSSLQPNFNAKYVGSGSGFGRQAWRNTTDQWPSGGIVNPFGTWNTVQFAFADSSITAGDLTTYNTNIASRGGAAVFFPKYVLPVAIAYNPVYGVRRAGPSRTNLSFNVQSPQSILGMAAGGLRMSRNTYCGVFNGTITNFNDTAFNNDNLNGSGVATSLQDPVNDTATRWTTDGVPIRLVGRLDRSGTTDIFTRALAAQCGTAAAGNKYAQHAETLPYSRGVAGTPDFQAVRADTGLRAASTETVAGSSNMVSNEYFNGTAITNSGVTGGGTSSMPVVVSGKAQGSGLFLVADGSGRVAAAINLAPDYVSPSVTDTTLNGKIGYIGADFIGGSPTSAGLFAAALSSSATGGTYVMPSAAEATNAVGSVAPPAGSARATQSNWYDVLYSSTPNLANPSTGYAITGTTQFLGYTCYKAGNLQNVQYFLGWNTDNVHTDSTGADKSGIFSTTGTTIASSGLLPRSNIGLMPAAWQQAIRETFLSNVSGLNLQMEAAGTGKCATATGM